MRKDIITDLSRFSEGAIQDLLQSRLMRKIKLEGLGAPDVMLQRESLLIEEAKMALDLRKNRN